MKRKVWAVILVLCFLFPSSGFPQDAALTNIIVQNTRDDLLLFFNVKGAFTEEMEKAILSGVPATFSFYVSLYRLRGLWMDEKITDLYVTHTIKYSNMKKEFTVSRSWEAGKPTITGSFDEAKKRMGEIESLKVVPLDRLEKGSKYQIKAKAELSKMTLPLYLHYVLFFVSLWDFETDWFTIDFTY